jgi:ribosome-binding protein aMBF1 (putative translation factor)
MIWEFVPSQWAFKEIRAAVEAAQPLRITTKRAMFRKNAQEFLRTRSELVIGHHLAKGFEATSLPELATALVKARISKGWTQRQLAEQLGVAEQQVQRYESTGYASASLARLGDIAAALGARVREVVTLDTDAA